MMRRKNSQKPLILQPPAGFRTANAEGVLTLSDGLLLKPDSRGLYHLDSAHLCLLPSFIAQGWHAPRPALRAPASEHTGGAQPLTTREILNLTGAERIALKGRGWPALNAWQAVDAAVG